MSGNLVVQDLGRLDGDVMVFGGCYSNLQATTAVYATARARGIEGSNLICTGDVVGYCADAAEVARAVRDSGCPIVAGNVERQIADNAADCGCGFVEGSTCDVLSAAWYPAAAAQIDDGLRNWMATLPDIIVFSHAAKRYAVIHGGISDIARFIWPVSEENDFLTEFEAAEGAVGPVDAIIAGHCGVAFERVVSGKHWINAGAIGMPPHDGRQETRFVVINEDGARIQRLDYDALAAANAMKRAGLTQGYHHTLLTGLWPSEDVLPLSMRRNQDFASG